MFNYIKWELKDEIRRKYIPLIVAVVVYLLFLILPEKSKLLDYATIPFVIIMLGSLAMSYIYGTYRTMRSYENQTFLLESMIPLSPNKILLAKYILAIIFDVAYSIIFVLGLATILFKFSQNDLELIKDIINLFFHLKIDEVTIILRVLFMMLSSTIAFTSFSTLVYLIIKSILPNFKRVVPISFIAGVLLFSILINGTLREFFDTLDSLGEFDIIYSVSLLIVSVICYFASVWFIKNKLEVYN